MRLKKPPQCSSFRLTVQAHIHRTESADRLEAALKNIVRLSTTNIERQGILVGTSNQVESLSIVYEQVKSRRSFSGTKKNADQQPRWKHYLISFE